MFTVDCENGLDAKRVSNYEVTDFAAQYSDIYISFASIDPLKGKPGPREARDLIAWRDRVTARPAVAGLRTWSGHLR